MDRKKPPRSMGLRSFFFHYFPPSPMALTPTRARLSAWRMRPIRVAGGGAQSGSCRERVAPSLVSLSQIHPFCSGVRRNSPRDRLSLRRGYGHRGNRNSRNNGLLEHRERKADEPREKQEKPWIGRIRHQSGGVNGKEDAPRATGEQDAWWSGRSCVDYSFFFRCS